MSAVVLFEISIFDQIFGFEQNNDISLFFIFQHQWLPVVTPLKVSIFHRNLNFWFLTNISIFYQNFNWSPFVFVPKFRFLTQKKIRKLF